MTLHDPVALVAAPMVYVAAFAMGTLWLWAGAAKIASRHHPAATIEAFGIPRRLARWTAWTTVGMELTLGAALVNGACILTASAALALLCGVFMIASYAAFARRVDVACACFGDGKSRLGMATLRRASGIGLACVSVAAAARANGMNALSFDAARSAGASVIVCALVARARYRRVTFSGPVLQILPLGARAPRLRGHAFDMMTTFQPPASGDGSVLFLDPHCTVCKKMAHEVASVRLPSLVAVIAGDVSAAQQFAETAGLRRECVVLDPGYQNARRYRLNGMPVIVAVRAGRIADAAWAKAVDDVVRIAALGADSRAGRTL